ncbi:TasA family protein [Arthrobacter sp. H5]|uniref:TasA family protein n=1 Tax=Arthrobacter sp. H5 TaxID=1267973 RepID=UPI000485DDBA|nr:TasA family protein [Arthrobacter sp. H5]
MGISLKSTSGKVLASVVLVGVAASVAGLGTYGSFTSTTSASEVVTAGTVQIALGTVGTAANRLNVAAAGIVPGDTIQRAATLSNTGNQGFASVSLTTSPTVSSKLNTDAILGLQLQVDACSLPWTETGTAPAYTYTCTGTTSTVLAQRAVVGANLPLANLTSLATGKTDNLRVTLSLPAAADNTFQGLSSTVAFDFTATQRTAESR